MLGCDKEGELTFRGAAFSRRRDPARRQAFLHTCRGLGVAGALLAGGRGAAGSRVLERLCGEPLKPSPACPTPPASPSLLCGSPPRPWKCLEACPWQRAREGSGLRTRTLLRGDAEGHRHLCSSNSEGVRSQGHHLQAGGRRVSPEQPAAPEEGLFWVKESGRPGHLLRGHPPRCGPHTPTRLDSHDADTGRKLQASHERNRNQRNWGEEKGRTEKTW